MAWFDFGSPFVPRVAVPSVPYSRALTCIAVFRSNALFWQLDAREFVRFFCKAATRVRCRGSRRPRHQDRFTTSGASLRMAENILFRIPPPAKFARHWPIAGACDWPAPRANTRVVCDLLASASLSTRLLGISHMDFKGCTASGAAFSGTAAGTCDQ